MPYRYGHYEDGPDPLAPPYDVRRALDALGDDVLQGSSLRDALRDMMRRGMDGRRGLDDLLRRTRQQRKAARQRGRLDGTLEEVRRLLDKALGQERAALFPDPSDEARFREAQLDSLPREPSRALRELSDYDWRSPQARQTYDEIQDLLRREVLDSQFRGLKQALQNPDSGAMQQVKDMLSDLNEMLAKDARGEHTSADFEDFMAKHGEFFPEQPESLEELVDALARRAAAAERMLNSMSREQRAELASLMEQTLGDLDLQNQMAQLQGHLRGRRPDLDWQGRQRMNGDRPLGMGEATSALEELADLDELEASLAQDYPGASLEDIDEEAVRRALGRKAVDDLEALRRLERELEQQGYLSRHAGHLELTPKAIRRLGQTALRRVFKDLASSGRGTHDVHDAGAAGEPTGASRQWEFGDEQPIDVVRTLSNAVRRGGASGGRVSVEVEDFEVVETERRSSAAVCLLVDLSYSMVLRDTWGPAKQTALALHALVTGQYPQDAVQIIGFSSYARVLQPGELAGLEADMVQGTNLQHALMLASRFLDKHRNSEPIVLVVTDGEPTAHLLPDGRPYFAWPPEHETITATVAEVDRMTRRGAALNVFLLDDDPRLVAFVREVVRRNGGRMLQPSADRLGSYVVSDYLRMRKGRGARRAS
ncbi:vWA domain-containing protein [Motilibacter deserti]|uniref:VWA domain-containing protein n=1 Tax=Motilibacter deserti TaxID=2714956 RepID=A0ABX0GVD1_9ACTN|nr:VWA domain-containing protein [Motilibacter deserti]NHC14468.1 VWA domain-containing protein [Motilibacter deserti]